MRKIGQIYVKWPKNAQNGPNLYKKKHICIAKSIHFAQNETNLQKMDLICSKCTDLTDTNWHWKNAEHGTS